MADFFWDVQRTPCFFPSSLLNQCLSKEAPRVNDLCIHLNGETEPYRIWSSQRDLIPELKAHLLLLRAVSHCEHQNLWEWHKGQLRRFLLLLSALLLKTKLTLNSMGTGEHNCSALEWFVCTKFPVGVYNTLPHTYTHTLWHKLLLRTMHDALS